MLLTDRDFSDLLDYWHSLKAETGRVPRRKRFNPMDIAWLLPNVAFLERREALDLHVRVMGTALDALSVRPLTGQNFLHYYPEEERGFYADCFTSLCGQPCGLWMDRLISLTSGHRYRALSLTLPFASDAGEVRYALTLVHPRARVGDLHRPPAGTAKSQTFEHAYIDLGFGVPDTVPAPAHAQAG